MTAAANRNSTRSAARWSQQRLSFGRRAGLAHYCRTAESPPGEQRVASYVLGQPIVSLIWQLPSWLKRLVTDPTIARFCRALGFTGFKAFQGGVGQSLATGVPYVHTDVSAQDSAADVVAKVFDRSIATLIAMRNQVDPKSSNVPLKQWHAPASRVLRRRQLRCRRDGCTQHKFFLLGMHTVAYNDPHWQVQSAALSLARMLWWQSRAPAVRGT